MKIGRQMMPREHVDLLPDRLGEYPEADANWIHCESRIVDGRNQLNHVFQASFVDRRRYLEGTGIVAVGKHLEPVEPQHFGSDCVREGPSRLER